MSTACSNLVSLIAEPKGEATVCVVFCSAVYMYIYVYPCIYDQVGTPWLRNCLCLPKHQGQLYLDSVRIKSVSNVVQSAHCACFSSLVAGCSCNPFSILTVGILASLPRPCPSLSGICLHAWSLLCAYKFRLLRNVNVNAMKTGDSLTIDIVQCTVQLARGLVNRQETGSHNSHKFLSSE